MEEAAIDKESRSTSRKLTSEQKKAIRFALSTLVLLVINFAYLYAGAYLFLALETENIQESCASAEKDYNDSRNATLQLMMDQATKLDKFSKFTPAQQQEVADSYRDMLRAYAATVLSTGYNASRPCSHMNANPNVDPLAWDSKWSMGNALLYALTIITTIGYGYTIPLTSWGKWATILYGIIGIPLLMACQINFGIILAKIFKVVYGSVCCCQLCRRKPKATEKKATTAGQKAAVFRTDASGKPIVDDLDAGAAESADDAGDGAAAAEEEEEDTLTVPLFISLLVIFVTLLSGMVIFMNLEGFDPVGGVYYTFISLATIGFGDLVPASSFSISGGDAASMTRCIGCTIFIFVGIAMISMCFQLINDEVTAKLEWLSAKAAAMKQKKEQQRAAEAAAAAAAK